MVTGDGGMGTLVVVVVGLGGILPTVETSKGSNVVVSSHVAIIISLICYMALVL